MPTGCGGKPGRSYLHKTYRWKKIGVVTAETLFDQTFSSVSVAGRHIVSRMNSEALSRVELPGRPSNSE